MPAKPERARAGYRYSDLCGPGRTQIHEFVEKIADPVNRFDGNDLPVSAFEPGGRVPTGSSK